MALWLHIHNKKPLQRTLDCNCLIISACQNQPHIKLVFNSENRCTLASCPPNRHREVSMESYFKNSITSYMQSTCVHSHLVVFVGVGYSWVVVGGDTAECNQWRGSGECRGWVQGCSAGPYTGYWTQSSAPQTDWTMCDRTGKESK